MKPTISEARVLKEVLRGARPWSDLQLVGITVTADDRRCQVDNPRNLSLAADESDIAHAIVALRHDPARLREWAWLIQASSSIFTLELEHDVRGEHLLEAIWDLAFGGELKEEIVSVAEGIISDETGSVLDRSDST